MNNCDSCADNYYPIEEELKNCVKEPQYYYLDNNVYKKSENLQ